MLSPSLVPAEWRAWCERLPALLQSSAAAPICHAYGQATSRKTFRIAGPDGSPLIAKCHSEHEQVPQFSPNGQTEFRHSWPGFRCNLELWQRGLGVPEPLAFVHFESAGHGMADCAITRELLHCQPVGEFAFAWFRRQLAPLPRRHQWCRRVLDAVVALHRTGYAHGDLHHHNILVRQRTRDNALEVFLVDFDLCAKAEERIPWLEQLHDLARLAATLYRLFPERRQTAMLNHYCRRLGLDRARWQFCRQTVVTAYHRILEEYLACCAQIEAACLAEAERCLTQGEAAP